MTWPSNQPPKPGLSAEDIARLNKKFAQSDAALGIEIAPDFKPFEQRN